MPESTQNPLLDRHAGSLPYEKKNKKSSECAGSHATLRRSKTRFDSWRGHSFPALYLQSDIHPKSWLADVGLQSRGSRAARERLFPLRFRDAGFAARRPSVRRLPHRIGRRTLIERSRHRRASKEGCKWKQKPFRSGRDVRRALSKSIKPRAVRLPLTNIAAFFARRRFQGEGSRSPTLLNRAPSCGDW